MREFWDTETWTFSPESTVSVQFSSVAQSCLTLCEPMNSSTPGLNVHHQLPEFTQTHIHRVSDAIQPFHPLSSPSPPAPNPSQHQSFPMSQLFAWGGQSTGISALASTKTWCSQINNKFFYKSKSMVRWAVDSRAVCVRILLLLHIHSYGETWVFNTTFWIMWSL